MNRRGFLGALVAAPVAAVVAVAAAKKPDNALQPAKYYWTSFHDGFAFYDDNPQGVTWTGQLDPLGWHDNFAEEPEQLELPLHSTFTEEQLRYAARASLEHFLELEHNRLFLKLRG